MDVMDPVEILWSIILYILECHDKYLNIMGLLSNLIREREKSSLIILPLLCPLIKY